MSEVTWITLFVIIPSITSIQTKLRPVRFVDSQSHSIRNFRHIDNSPSRNFDWEPGLREATVQALLREPIVDHNLRRHIYGAPLLGKQDKSTPFGDVAVLARGQLYANFAGFIFVQDPYQNDCDECHRLSFGHRERCISNHCQKWRPRSNEQLIGLWSVKRIRHRTPKDGYNLEVEYTISPIGVRYSKDRYITPEGTFNYNYPGHIFVLRTSDIDSVKINLLNQGAYIAQSPDGTKYILHNYPAVLLPQKYLPAKENVPLPTSSAATQFTEEDPSKLYQTLLDLLHKKTSVDPYRLTPTTQKTTTLVQLPTGQLVPITELQTPGYVSMRFPETTPFQPSTLTSKQPTLPTTTKQVTQHLVPTTLLKVETTLPQTSSSPTTPQVTYTNQQVFYTNGLQTTRQPLYTTASEITEPQSLYTNTISESTKQHLYTSSTPQITKPQPFYTNTIPQSTKPQIIYTNALPQTTKYQLQYTSARPETTRFTNAITHTTKLQPTYTTQPVVYSSTTRPPVKTTFSFFAAEEQPQKNTATQPTKHFTTRTTQHQPPTEPTRYTSGASTLSDFSIPITVPDEVQFESTYTDESTIPTKFTTSSFTTNTQPLKTTEETGPTKYSIDTTLVHTSTLGTSQNKSTELVYFMAEEASTTPKPTTKATTTKPERILTTIASDGRVSVKTTPLDLDQELFGLTKSTTKVLTSPRPVATQPSQFLAEESPLEKPKVPLFAKPVRDYSEDEIFGGTKSTRIPTSPRSTRKYDKSDLEQALFDTNGQRSGKNLIRRKLTRSTEATPSKVIYADHLETPTTPMNLELVTSTTTRPATTKSRKIYSVSKKPTTEKPIPVTVQSLQTSISYEVNRKKKYVNKDRNKNSLENDFALRLASQAKGIEYLDATSTTGASTIASTIASTTKKSKYTRRRSYIPKAQTAKKKVRRYE